ncbi:glycosyltransferase family 4 protein [Leclercia sp. G3L]|uniref:glycosyltransferase family 4 protein n=1 Tax=Leclercia sp. G3L TaxID=2898725 RepID=UPI001E3162EB|nr:glycosyltransferase family 4 protein [Leclercia sp. G3L]UGB01007.1 glycosyltransferase family 4 protein [Leclercia sp. G3L]
MEKILIICTKYPLELNNTWLTRELAEELASRKKEVHVLCMDWNGKNKPLTVKINNINVSYFPALKYSKSGFFNFIVKWMFSSVIASIKYCKIITRNYDLVICFSPCASTWFPILLGKVFSKKNLLIYWDFFPIHQVKINLIKGKFKEKILYTFERSLVRLFDYVGCMSEMNCEFYKNYFGSKASNVVFELPIWSEQIDKNVVLNNKKNVSNLIDDNSIYFVFGGQIDYGRGVECILEAAAIAHGKNSKIKTIIIGKGRLVGLVKKTSEDAGSGIIYSDYIPRDEYMNLLSFCRAGIVATVPNVPVPTYPSKSLDYMKLSLPVIASVEESTDFGDIIVDAQAGLKCTAGDAESLSNAIIKLAEDAGTAIEMGKKANALFAKKHEIKKVVDEFMLFIKED